MSAWRRTAPSTDMLEEARRHSRLLPGFIPAVFVAVMFCLAASTWLDRLLIVMPMLYAAAEVLQLRLCLAWLLLSQGLSDD